MKPLLILALLVLLAATAFAQGVTILKPSEGTSFEKDERIEVEVRVDIPSGWRITSVSAYLSGMKERAMSLAKNTVGNYAGDIQLEHTFQSQEVSLVVVVTSKDAVELEKAFQTQIRINITPSEITYDFSLVPAAPYYIGTVLEKVKLNADYPDGSRVDAGRLSPVDFAVGSAHSALSFATDANGEGLVAGLGYAIPLEEKFLRGEEAVIEIGIGELRDAYGNRGFGKTQALRVTPLNPALGLEVKNAGTQSEPLGRRWLVFDAEVIKGAGVENPSVYFMMGGERGDCGKKAGQGSVVVFGCKKELARGEELAGIEYVVVAEADLGGRRIASFKAVELRQEPFSMWAILIVAALFAGLTFVALRYFVSRYLQRFISKVKKEKTIEEINDEVQQIKEEMKIFEQQLWRRKVSEGDFTKGMFAYQAKLRVLEGKKKLLEGKKKEAAELYEKAGNYAEATKLYAELGDKEGMARIGQLELRQKVLRKE